MTYDHPVTVVPQLQFLTQKTPSPSASGASSFSSTGAGAVSAQLRGAPTTTSNTAAAITTDGEPLSHAIRVLLYSGEFDLNTNTLGTLHTLEANRWRGK